jgi:tetratricopeptide (TPR) repeat protein
MANIEKEKLQKYQKGELRFTELFNIDPEQIASLLQCGYNFFSHGKLDDAKILFEGMAVLYPGNPYVHTILGALYQKMENYPLAIDHYSLGIRFFPQDITALTNRGEIYLMLGKFQEAADDLKKVIELDPQANHPSTIRARLLVTIATELLESARKTT